MLALSAPDVVSTDRLVDGVWGEDPPAKPLATLQVFVHNVRKALRDLDPGAGTDLLVRRQPGYFLQMSAATTDVETFDALVRRARTSAVTEPTTASRLLREALGLWRGPALADIRDAPFADAEVARMEEQRLLAEEDVFDLDLRLGEHHQIVPALEDRVHKHPTRERFWGQLMVALYRSDRQADALTAYGRARDRLAEELGIDPGEALRQLEVGILRQDPALSAPVISAVSDQAAIRPVPTPRRAARVPRPLTPTIGRDAEVRELVTRLADADIRLVTLTGPGGSGKTRLATVVAQRCGDDFPAGTWFLSLTDVEEAQQMLSAVGRAVAPEVASDDDPLDTLATAVGDAPALLVLDNLEGVDGAPAAVSQMLERVQCLTVLATSRLPLRSIAEHEHPVAPLGVPAAEAATAEVDGAAAVQLFVSRARASMSGFKLNDANRHHVAELCRLVDGVPLAIELAAARVRLMSPETIARRLRTGLELLTSNSPEVPVRQRAVATTVAWSYAHLDESAQRMCDRLTVFERGFTLEAVEAVCADGDEQVLDALTALVDASVVRSVESRVEVRFVLLATVRAYVRGRLGHDPDLMRRRERLARWLLEQAKAWSAELDGPAGPVVLGRFDDVAADMEAVLQWACVTGEPTVCVDMAVALHDCWIASGRLADGLAHAESALATPGVTISQQARLRTVLAKLAYHRTDWPRTRTECEAALELVRGLPMATCYDEETAAVARCHLGAVMVVTGEAAVGAGLVEQALADAVRLDLYPLEATALSALAIASAVTGDMEGEQMRHEQRLDVVRAHSDRARIADTLNTLAEIALDEPDADTARTWAHESLALAQGVLPLETRDALISLARAEVACEHPERAVEPLRVALTLCERTGQALGTAQCLRTAAGAAVLVGDAESAALLFAAAQKLHPSPSGRDEPAEGDFCIRLRQAREQLGEAAFATAWTRGTVRLGDQALLTAERVLERL